MRQAIVVFLGLLLLVLGALALPTGAGGRGSLLSELGRSLGGAGVLVVDGLFLRADALRAQGRPEEVPALYRAALELDPHNPVAADFLVSVLAVDLVNDAPDTPERLAWWTEAWALLQRARSKHPDDPSLAMRTADLLLDVPLRHADLLPGVIAAVGDPRVGGLDALLEAARSTPTLPRRGRQHLEWLAFVLPVVAAEQGPGTRRDEILARGDDLLTERRETLAQVRALREGAAGEIEATSMARILARGIEAVRALDRAEIEGDAAAAAAVLADLASDLPELPLLEALRARVERLR